MRLDAPQTISEGTTRLEDLAYAVGVKLEQVAEDQDDRHLAQRAEIAACADQSYNPVSLQEAYDAAVEALQEHAPPYCYIGMDEGDGAHLGVWVDVEAASDDARNGEIAAVTDKQPLAALDPEEHGLALEVNDHGNATLFEATMDGSWRIAWSVV